MKTAMDIPDKEGQKRLVIVGGGFGGLKLARKLKSNKFQIVLLDKNNHHIFQLLVVLFASINTCLLGFLFFFICLFRFKSIFLGFRSTF